MQLMVPIVFLLATAICNSNVSHIQKFVKDPEKNPAVLNQENLTVLHNFRSPQLLKESKNEVPVNENENLNEAEETSVQSPTPMKEKNIEEKERGIPAEEKNEVSDVNKLETKSNQTTSRRPMPNYLLQEEKAPIPTLNCSISWPECTNPYNALEDVSRQLTRFALDLYKTLSSRDEDSNIVIAPISIALGLSQLMLGSVGKTREDMLKIIYGGMKDTQCVHNAIRNLSKHNSFVSANQIFFNKDISLKEEFIKQSKRFYGSEGTQLKNGKRESLKQINSWVSRKTNELITSMFDELPDFQLMLINVIYYQGKWMNQFNPELTKKEVFQTTTSSEVWVPMMKNHKYPLQSFQDTNLKAHVARLPLSDNCSLITFLPLSKEKDALKNVEKRLTEDIVNLLMTQLQEKSPRATYVSFPKLKLDSDFGLTETLSKLGLYYLFENPDFSALSDSTELAISDVRHRAVLEIKEDGAKAAAATSVTVARTMPTFSAQRPFLYILANDISKIPIIIGRVTDPSK